MDPVYTEWAAPGLGSWLVPQWWVFPNKEGSVVTLFGKARSTQIRVGRSIQSEPGPHRCRVVGPFQTELARSKQSGPGPQRSSPVHTDPEWVHTTQNEPGPIPYKMLEWAYSTQIGTTPSLHSGPDIVPHSAEWAWGHTTQITGLGSGPTKH